MARLITCTNCKKQALLVTPEGLRVFVHSGNQLQFAIQETLRRKWIPSQEDIFLGNAFDELPKRTPDIFRDQSFEEMARFSGIHRHVLKQLTDGERVALGYDTGRVIINDCCSGNPTGSTPSKV